MKKNKILSLVLLASVGTIGMGGLSTAPKTKNEVLLTQHAESNNKIDNNNINKTNNNTSNQTLSKKQAESLKNKTVTVKGMKFSGLTTMKIAPDMNSFAAIPGFDQDGFASNINKQLYDYELNPANDETAMNEAIQLHGGDPTNTCVFFQSSALRGIGQDVPDYIGYTTHLENWLSNNGWTRHTNFATIQRGDICFASYYHTFLFMGWENKEKGVAYVMGNESYSEPYFRNRNLNGQSPVTYGDNNSYYQATCYWTYGQGYTGVSSAPNPVQGNGYNEIGTATTKATVNLRASDGTWSSILGQVPSGTTLAVMAQNGEWFEVYYDGQSGWVSANYTNGLDESMGSGATANMPQGDNLTVTANDGLWLTATPNGSNIVCLPNGTPVKAIGWKNGYYKVNYEGTIGWLNAQYTSANGSDILPASATISSNSNTPSSNSNSNTNSNSNSSSNTGSSFTQKSVNGTVTIDCDGLWLNSNPFPNDGNQVVVPQGAKVQATAESSNGWYKVTYKGVTGWVGGSPYSSFTSTTSAHVDTPTTVINSKPASSTTTGTIDANGGLWLNTNPNLSNPQGIEVIPNGASVKILKVQGAWSLVNYNGTTGWSYNQYINTNSATKVTPKPAAAPKPVSKSKTTTGTINANGGLWLNGNPNLSNPEGIEVIPNGATVQILEVQGDWDLVSYNGTTGWSYKQYINTNAPTVITQTATVADSDGLWLNANPNLNNPQSIEVMPQGATMQVLGQQGNWTEVNYNGTTGWAYTQYLNIN